MDMAEKTTKQELKEHQRARRLEKKKDKIDKGYPMSKDTS